MTLDDFKKSVDAVIKQDEEKKDIMRQAATLYLAQDVARGQGIFDAAKRLQELCPFFVDEHRLLWVWVRETSSWRLSADSPSRPVELITIMRIALNLVGDASVRYESLIGKAIQQVGISKRPTSLGTDWIQLGSELHNIRTGEVRESTPEWFVSGAIPWTPNKTEDTPTIDRLLKEWVGVDRAKTLQEIIAYTLYRDYPLHVLVAFYGSGRNGKGTFFRLLREFLGADNIASTEIDRLLENRFESFHLFGKLAALVGETDDAIISKTSLLKSLSGQDPIPFEMKGGAQFTAINTTKIILSTNNLPPSTDASDGWARRWLIIDFPNQFLEGHDILETIPKEEYGNLARRSIRILSDLLKRGCFSGQGSIEERRQRYIERSEPIRQFLTETYEESDPEAFVAYGDIYAGYCRWLSEKHRRTPSRGSFSKQLSILGYSIDKTSKKFGDHDFRPGVWVIGLRKKELCSLCSLFSSSELEKSHIERNENTSITSTMSTNEERIEEKGHLRAYSIEEIAANSGLGVAETEIQLRQLAVTGEVCEIRSGWWLRIVDEKTTTDDKKEV